MTGASPFLWIKGGVFILLTISTSFLDGESDVRERRLVSQPSTFPKHGESHLPLTATHKLTNPKSQYAAPLKSTMSVNPVEKETLKYGVSSAGTQCAINGHHTAMGSSGSNLSILSAKKRSLPVHNGSMACGTTSFCFTLWVSDPNNASKVTISKQGCWQTSEEEASCKQTECLSHDSPAHNNTHFCCCEGFMCNSNFKDVYDPSKHTTNRPPTTTGHSHSQDYHKRIIINTMVSVISVAVLIMVLYLLYRLCLNFKPSSSNLSSETEAMVPPPVKQWNLADLQVGDVLVRGRYSEVRTGWLGQTQVAIKSYQPHHKQYYQNEYNAFSFPFMEHENLVKFYGGREDLTLSSMQYIIVTGLVPKGALNGYLKYNTLDRNTLCRMCQDVSRGLAYLHTDIHRGTQSKPALAHRDLNTRNILVSDNLTCVIADLGFSVGMIGSKIVRNGITECAEQASLADVGTLHYMAPEVFDGAVNLRDCEASLKQIDVYALGLVLWEIARRCTDLYQGAPIPEYSIPYQAEAGTHPSFEAMQVLVVRHKTRPKFPEVWKDNNPAIRSLKETIEDCWDTDAEARLTALCVTERLSDMAVLWNSQHRDVTPTLNLNTEGHTGGSAVVANGVAYLPSFVDQNNELNQEMVRGDDQSSRFIYHQPEMRHQDMVQLISDLSESEGQERSWPAQETSVSTLESELSPALPASPKEDNVVLARRQAILTGPHQGRNPTVERNTHKCSDEELTVSGNRLLGPGETIDIDSPAREGEELTALVTHDLLNEPRTIPYLQNQVNTSQARPKQANRGLGVAEFSVPPVSSLRHKLGQLFKASHAMFGKHKGDKSYVESQPVDLEVRMVSGNPVTQTCETVTLDNLSEQGNNTAEFSRRLSLSTGHLDDMADLPRPQSLSLKGHNYSCPNGGDTMVVPNVTLNQTAKGSNLSVVQATSSRSTDKTQKSSDKVEEPVDSQDEVAKLTDTSSRQEEISREKIRRRVKTPVSFSKGGRLSLYDDRLMSQSVVVPGVKGSSPPPCMTQSMGPLGGGRGDRNNNDGGGQGKTEDITLTFVGNDLML